ncbi:MAG: 23S rRNA (adenine(2503)-C(2))-methyltransferase RlmN [bacterium]
MIINNNNNKIDIKNLTLSELEEVLINMGEPKFRAKQIFTWLHQKGVTRFEDMSNISKDLRAKLDLNFILTDIKILDKLISKDDGTIKYLFILQDEYIIESVFMKYSYGNAVCISSQVGCRMGCTFCASTIGGLERNLLASEMLSQIYLIQQDTGQKVRSIVVMGSGEPFDNFDEINKFISIINSKDGINIGQRHLTISTCGVVPKIYEFADKNLQVNLAISLHSPYEEERKKIMPIANKYSINEIIEACKYFSDKTKRRVTYEYALISGINDREQDAKKIVELLRGTLCHINLIPINSVEERDYIKSSKKQIKKFGEILDNSNIDVTIRRELGSDINAACGQLRKSYKDKK